MVQWDCNKPPRPIKCAPRGSCFWSRQCHSVAWGHHHRSQRVLILIPSRYQLQLPIPYATLPSFCSTVFISSSSTMNSTLTVLIGTNWQSAHRIVTHFRLSYDLFNSPWRQGKESIVKGLYCKSLRSHAIKVVSSSNRSIWLMRRTNSTVMTTNLLRIFEGRSLSSLIINAAQFLGTEGYFWHKPMSVVLLAKTVGEKIMAISSHRMSIHPSYSINILMW